MRLVSLASAIALLGCGSKKDSSTDQPAPGGAPAPKQPAPVTPKKPIDKTPLPPLAKDPGGATGKPVNGVGIGSLGIDASNGIAMGPAGEVYVVGYYDSELDLGALGKFTPTPPDPPTPAEAKKKAPPPSDAFLARVDPDGKIAWFQTWGDKREDAAKAVAVNGDVVMVVGNYLDHIDIGGEKEKRSGFGASGSDDLFAVTFDKTGKHQWTYTLGGVDSDGANAVAPALDGGWYIGGSFRKTVKINDVEYQAKGGGSDALLIKLDRAGKVEWHKTFGGVYDDTILHAASDARGNVYVQGHFRDKSEWGGAPLIAAGGADNDVVVAKYDANGEHLWSKRFGNTLDDVAGGITVDPAGNFAITGSFDRAITFAEGNEFISNGESDIYIARFDAQANLTWAKTYGADRPDIGWGIASDAAGNVISTGWFEGKVDFGKTTLGAITSKGNKDVFVIKHDPNGAVIWLQSFGDKDHDQGRGIAVDPKGGIAVTGLYRFSLGFVTPALESVRAAGDRIPKPDTFVIRMER